MTQYADARGVLQRLSDPTTLGQVQGWFNILGGAWPLLSLATFEKVFGPKVDRWLEYTVAGLLITNGISQVISARKGEVEATRLVGCGTALTLLGIDAVFVPAGTIRWTYLGDAAFQAGWIALWIRARER